MNDTIRIQINDSDSITVESDGTNSVWLHLYDRDPYRDDRSSMLFLLGQDHIVELVKALSVFLPKATEE